MKDEPGGYNGFTALYGNVNVQPQISPTGPVKDLDGNVVADSHGNPGFPGFDPSPSQTLGYLATMLEAGVPVVYGYIEDAHDNQGQAISGVSTSTEQTFGPGQAGYVTQLKAFNKAFGEFFARLAKNGITKNNTLFIITADENDHFVGGPPSPATCDGVTTPCTYALKGQIGRRSERGIRHRVRGCDAVPRAQRQSTDLLHHRQPGADFQHDPPARAGSRRDARLRRGPGAERRH